MSGVKFNVGVLNYGGLPSGGSGLLAARPAAGVVGRIYIASDSAVMFRDNGTAWVTIGGSGGSLTGTGSAGQATFWTAALTISGDNAFWWDNTNKRLGINTSSPGVRLDIHGTGVIQQINGTTTNNAYLDFQNAGTSKWRIGNIYNASLNDFAIQNLSVPLTNALYIAGNNGNVGISTSVPETKLHISNVTGGTLLILGETGATAKQFYLGVNLTGNGYGYIQSVFQGTATTPIVLNPSGGNIGTGSYVTPASRLAVDGSVLVNTNTANALYELFNNGNFYTGGLSPTNSTVGVNTVMARTQTGYVCTATLTLTLPAVSGLNNIYFVVANTGATVTVQRAGADTILDKTGTSQTSVTVAAGTRSMFYCGGGSITYQIF